MVVNKVMNVVVLMGFVSVYRREIVGGAFFMFAGISVLVGFFFFYFFLPDTKGRSLEEMEMLFQEKD